MDQRSSPEHVSVSLPDPCAPYHVTLCFAWKALQFLFELLPSLPTRLFDLCKAPCAFPGLEVCPPQGCWCCRSRILCFLRLRAPSSCPWPLNADQARRWAPAPGAAGSGCGGMGSRTARYRGGAVGPQPARLWSRRCLYRRCLWWVAEAVSRQQEPDVETGGKVWEEEFLEARWQGCGLWNI